MTPTEHVVRIMNDAWLGLLLSFGERLGLHEAMADGTPRTAEEIALAADVNARYVQEWVWALVAGGIADHTCSGPQEPTRFHLRPGYAAVLTPRGGPEHWSRITTQITALGALEDELVEAARTGGGLPTSAYEGRIVEVLATESGPIFATALLDEVVPLLGVHPALSSGVRVLDIGCGTGQALCLLAERYPTSTFIGCDQSPDSLDIARERVARLGLTNVTLHVLDVEDGDDPLNTFEAPFHLVMAANVAHDLADPGTFFRRIRPLLAEDGVLYLHELGFVRDMAVNITDPHAIGVLAFGLYHCLPLAMRRPGIAPGGMWGCESWVETLNAAGFPNVRVERAPSDPNNDTIIARLH
ncbi:class I SAM-dependent methyltransferase [Aeromicrobium sp. PE09-221]|uniref:class I SAM-dependent methyltransferase n=1 Tax=Aeromicrobium sp. PE09-221 TaxID=1898043 RepID=UPI001481F1EC|nr:class I SAM-dependent methyltransferase [Aeromicrobium sp. PE09-221]